MAWRFLGLCLGTLSLLISRPTLDYNPWLGFVYTECHRCHFTYKNYRQNLLKTSQKDWIYWTSCSEGKYHNVVFPKRRWTFLNSANLGNLIEFFTVRSNLHFKPKFTSKGLKNFSKKLQPSTGNWTYNTDHHWISGWMLMQIDHRGLCYLADLKLKFVSCTISHLKNH